MLLFIKSLTKEKGQKCRFNTSHVTLYREFAVYTMYNAKFQYISCYSLSKLRMRLYQMDMSFNTSHVTLYRIFYMAAKANLISFNTSHVTLYRGNERPRLTWISVSIHLMLLFIRPWKCCKKNRSAFQYISCYSLSTQ